MPPSIRAGTFGNMGRAGFRVTSYPATGCDSRTKPSEVDKNPHRKQRASLRTARPLFSVAHFGHLGYQPHYLASIRGFRWTSRLANYPQNGLVLKRLTFLCQLRRSSSAYDTNMSSCRVWWGWENLVSTVPTECVGILFRDHQRFRNRVCGFRKWEVAVGFTRLHHPRAELVGGKIRRDARADVYIGVSRGPWNVPIFWG
jgi:hypothetical protein